MHAAPADFALRRQSLAEILRQCRRPRGMSLRSSSCFLPDPSPIPPDSPPNRCGPPRTAECPGRAASARSRKPSPPAVRNAAASSALPIAEPPPVAATPAPPANPPPVLRRDFSASTLQIVVASNRYPYAARTEKDRRLRIASPSTSAAAVRFSIVSRSMAVPHHRPFAHQSRPHRIVQSRVLVLTASS